MPKTPMPLRAPLLAALALSLSAFRCSPDTEVHSTPPAYRFERVIVAAPEGEAQCDDDGDGVAEPCLSQAQGEDLFNDVVTALCKANDRLAWLGDYYLGTVSAPSCGALTR